MADILRFPRIQIITHPRDCLDWFECIKDLDHEKLGYLMTDKERNVLGVKFIDGEKSSCKFNVRDILRDLIMNDAAGVVFAHNHPLGSLVPSDDDMVTFSKLEQACKLCGITMMDSIIITQNGYMSWAEYGLLKG